VGAPGLRALPGAAALTEQTRLGEASAPCRVWGLREPEDWEDAGALLAEMAGLLEDLEELGFEAAFDLSTCPPTLFIVKQQGAEKEWKLN